MMAGHPRKMDGGVKDLRTTEAELMGLGDWQEVGERKKSQNGS